MKRVLAVIMLACSSICLFGSASNAQADDVPPACTKCVIDKCSLELEQCAKTEGCEEVMACIGNCPSSPKDKAQACIKSCTDGKVAASISAYNFVSCMSSNCKSECTKK